jgi:hypothetical protein
MGGKPLNAELYEKIVTDRLVYGVPVSQIAKEIERNPTSVTYVVGAFECVRDRNWERAAALIVNYKIPVSPFYWAGEKLNVEIPQYLEEVYEKRKAEKAAWKAQKRQQAEASKTPPAPVPELEPIPEPEPKKEDNTGLYLIKLLEAVNRQNELLEQLYDVVIPKWVGDMKDNVNCNSDVLSQSLKRIDDKLEAIKINVRKRGL